MSSVGLAALLVSGRVAGQEPGLPAGAEPAPIEVTVRADAAAERLRQSAEAVKVVDTERARAASADLGEVLSREAGVAVRRSGGLGTGTELSLGGLGGDQIRLFLDGVPLDFAGYPLGVANVPVSLVERVELYRGVVPVRFGADALGGAVNLVSDQSYRGTHAGASHSFGSFDTHRAAATARHHLKQLGLFARASGFVDAADNDYPMDVQVADETGRLRRATVRRFHDGYLAYGGGVELGAVQRPWAKRLLVHLFTTRFDKELQHDLSYGVAASPAWGEVSKREEVRGATLRFEKSDARMPRLKLSALAGYAHRELGFRDASQQLYDWYGRPYRMRPQFPGQLQTGERGQGVTDSVLGEHRAIGRLDVAYRIGEQHALHLNVSSSHARRAGRERLRYDPAQHDPLRDAATVVSLVLGLEYVLRVLDDRLENVVFVKDYVHHASGMGTEQLVRARRDTASHTQGAGDAVRLRLTEWLWTKASYEYATRLPRSDEVLGAPGLIEANAELEPEVSHNANLGLVLDLRAARSGDYRGELSGFVRHSDALIQLLVRPGQASKHFNFRTARTAGVEASAGWVSPGRYLELTGNVSYVDARLVAAEGAFATFNGDRLRNLPWLFVNASARTQLARVLSATDELSLTWISRYVHDFFLGWESGGAGKAVIPAQLQHTLVLSYVLHAKAALSYSAEIQNVTDARVYDYLGIQKPGRAFFSKLSVAY